MSYTPNFAPDAWLEFVDLDFWMQEAVLDVLDVLADDPSLLRARPISQTTGVGVHETAYDRPDGRYHQHVRILRDDRTARLRVLGVGVVKTTPASTP